MEIFPHFERHTTTVNLNEQTQSPWRRSSYCGTNACVEIATTPDGALMRDSKRADSPALGFDRRAWVGFLEAIKAGKMDLG
jgi:hypothetical protein